MRQLTLALALALSACSSGDARQAPAPGAEPPPEPTPPPPLAGQLDDFELPDGFRVQQHADQLVGADALALATGGDVVVAAGSEGQIVRLIDADHDGVAEATEVFADADNALLHPHGVVFTPGAAFVANATTLMRHALVSGQRRLEGPGGRVGRFPDFEGHEQHPVTLAADRRHLFVAIDDVDAAAEERASVVEVSFSGARRRVVATGVAGVTGLAVEPGSGALWATLRGDERDSLTRIEEGARYDGDEARAPELVLPAGSEPAGLAFPRGPWPEGYRAGAFVALRGSRSVIFVPIQNGEVGEPTTLLAGPETVWDGPNALLTTSDGSLFVADERGRVLRVVAPR